ncbi:MAG: hypothetical protein JO341_12235 [Gammaproteobacteria bacterium]|nr:hypothetical protein [Gammaproteobacteria bacterium]MBV9621773.1 hypothetical protein [Gammaproteobacteria bacterium]
MQRAARIDLAGNLTLAGAALAVAVAFMWPTSKPPHATPPVAPPVARVSEVAPEAPAEPPGEPVRIRNAFDRTEVFEFPAGTSEADAKAAVAQMLLSRAHDRWAARRGGNAQTRRQAANEQPDALANKLLVRAKEPGTAP